MCVCVCVCVVCAYSQFFFCQSEFHSCTESSFPYADINNHCAWRLLTDKTRLIVNINTVNGNKTHGSV